MTDAKTNDEITPEIPGEIDTSGATVRVPRRRGAVAGILLMVLGAWAAVAPFIGPSFDFGFTPDNANWTSARGWLEVLPGVMVVLAGDALLMTTNRIFATVASWFAIAGGAWLIIGPQLAGILNVGTVGTPLGTTERVQAAENLIFFYGIGAAIVALGAIAFGRLSARTVGDVRAARVRAAVEERQARHARDLSQKERIEVPMAPPTPLPTTTPPPSPATYGANTPSYKRNPGAEYPPAPPPPVEMPTDEQSTERVEPVTGRLRRH